jgi:fibro-slime domain-containing protein
MTRLLPTPIPRRAVWPLSLSALLCLPSLGTAQSGEGPQRFDLVGVVRDFREHTAAGGHPDFERVPESGFGIYAGLVHQELGPDRKPAYTGEGYQVLQQPTDNDGRPIAWHMFNSFYVCGSGLPDEPCVILHDSQGKPNFEICFVGVDFNGDGTSTWSYTVRERGVPGGKDLSHWNLKLDQSHGVVGWTPAAPEQHVIAVSVGVDGSTGLYSIKWDVADAFGNDLQPVLFTVTLDKEYFGGTIATGVLAKGGNNADSADFFGPTIMLSTNGTPLNPTLSLTYDASREDVMGELGPHDAGAIESAASFAQWFRDVPGVNMSRPLAITFHMQDDGTYVYDAATDPRFVGVGGFFPIENDLFGQSGGTPDRNFHFTVEFQADFTYWSDAGNFFRFSADGDLWVFINGVLVIDLGGVHGREEQFIDLDRLCLENGERYRISIFRAQRHRPESEFRVHTDLPLEPRDVPTATALFD